MQTDRESPITKSELNKLEKLLDSLFDSLNIDVEFTRHFLDRLNDSRNGKQITKFELAKVYTSVYKKFGVKISNSKNDVEKLIKSLSTQINIPVVLKWNDRSKEIEMIAKTIMRKRDFKTSTPTMKVEMKFKEYISEGGAFGHLSHPYDVNMKFNDLFKLIHDSLNGKLDYAEEKTDGTNMLFTVKNGKILFARNKGHLKNRGENAMTIQEIRKKFSGRAIGDAYSEAFNDLSSAMSKINKKQQDYIFFKGRAWMSIEVIGIGSDNIIPYGTSEIRFHGTSEYDDRGVKSTDINKKNAKILDGMFKQRQAQQQKTFHISNLSRVDIPKLPNFKQLESKYVSKVKQMLSKYRMSGGNTINDYKEAYWMSIIDKRDLPEHVKKALVKRWAHFNKSVTIAKISKELDDKDVKWVKALESEQKRISADAMKPLKDVFLRLGQDVINQMTNVMAVNPDKAVQEIRKKIQNSTSKIKDSGNTALIKKLESELTRLQSVGNKVMPTEGITFFYLDSNKERHFLKLTGSFAPVNSLINLVWRL